MKEGGRKGRTEVEEKRSSRLEGNEGERKGRRKESGGKEVKGRIRKEGGG